MPKFSLMKRIFLFLILFFTVFSASSQIMVRWYNWGKSLIDKPEKIDTLYVYQLPARFCAALTATTKMTGFFAYADFKLLDTYEVQSLSYLGERLCKQVGFEVGYGSLSFGYGFELGRSSADYKRSLSLGLSNLKWGLGCSYFGLQNHIITSLTIGSPDDDFYMDTIEESAGLGKMRNISVGGYYVLNNKRFAYTATNTINVVQKRTAGSFMLGGRFMWSELDTKEDMSGLFESYSTIQFALGGGYSLNVVLWNRDAINNDDRTVRNITFNVTAMPVVSLVNYLQTKAYTFDIDSDFNDTQTLKKSDVWCYPSPNIVSSAAISMTWGHFYCTSQFNFNMFYFTSQNAVDEDSFEAPNIYIEGYEGDIFSDVSLHGILYNWSLSAKVYYRF